MTSCRVACAVLFLSAGFGAEGVAQNVRFSDPVGVAIDRSGNVYVADSSEQTIRKISPDGMGSTLAGSPGMRGNADGIGSSARFSDPSGIATDSSGNIYVADASNHTIRKITPSGVVTTFAGSPGLRGSADGKGRAARFYFPTSIATDRNGNVYVADTKNSTIRKITALGMVTTLAGAALSSASDDGAGNAARFDNPRGVATDLNGNVYVADTENNTIRKISPAGVVSTLAGSPGRRYSTNGRNIDYFLHATGIAVDRNGNVYVADSVANEIRKVTPAGPPQRSPAVTVAELAEAPTGSEMPRVSTTPPAWRRIAAGTFTWPTQRITQSERSRRRQW
jgi:sugar lactone lactonase YvrE